MGRGEEGSFYQSFGRPCPSLSLPLNPVGGHDQVSLPPASSGTQGSDTRFCPSHSHQGWVLLCCSGTSCEEGGLVWLRIRSVLPRSVERWAVIYAHSKDVLNHPIFMVSPLASSLFPSRVTSCLFGFISALGAGIAVLSCPGSELLSALLHHSGQ